MGFAELVVDGLKRVGIKDDFTIGMVEIALSVVFYVVLGVVIAAVLVEAINTGYNLRMAVENCAGICRFAVENSSTGVQLW